MIECWAARLVILQFVCKYVYHLCLVTSCTAILIVAHLLAIYL